jgi:hypothetical protein
MDQVDKPLDGDVGGSDEQLVAEPEDLLLFVDDHLLPVEPFIVASVKIGMDDLLQSEQVLLAAEQGENVHLLPGGHFHAADHGDAFRRGVLLHRGDVLGRVMVANTDHLQSLSLRFAHDLAG